MNLEFLQNIDWATPTWDLFIVLFFILASFLYGMSLGRGRILVILVSIYMALAIVNYAPFLGEQNAATINIGDAFALQITTFLGVFVLLFFLLSRSAVLKTLGNGAGDGSWWQVMLFSALHVGLLVSITLSFLPAEAAEGLAPMTKTIFVGENARFAWIVAPILIMLVSRGGGSEE